MNITSSICLHALKRNSTSDGDELIEKMLYFYNVSGTRDLTDDQIVDYAIKALPSADWDTEREEYTHYASQWTVTPATA